MTQEKIPRTMTAEREADIRAKIDQFWGGSDLLTELDAERAAHDASKKIIREKCARIADGEAITHFPDTQIEHRAHEACRRIAAAIRSGK